MPTQTRHKSVAKRLHDPHRPGRPPKALTPEKEPKPKTIGMAMSVEDMAEDLPS